MLHQVDKWDNFQNGSMNFFLFYISIHFFKYETIVKSSTSSFGDIDLNPGSVSSDKIVLGKAQFNLRKCQPSGQMSFLLHCKTNMCNGPEFAGLFSDDSQEPVHYHN